VPTYLSAQRIATAVARLSSSRAKAAVFDFLVVKRTLVIKGAPAVAITETEPTFIKALDEFGACGEYNGRPVKPDEKFYVNPFVTREKGRQGYRQKRYRSNGTNSTIGGTHWRSVIALSDDDPRKASLAPEYLEHLEPLLLKAGKDENKPNLTEIAVWYFRGQDIEPLFGAAATPNARLAALTQEFRTRVALTNEEIGRLFTTGVDVAAEGDAFSANPPSPLDYLPGEPEPEPIVAAEDVGSCSLNLVMALAAKNFVILTGPSGTGKSRSALRLAESIQHAYADKVNGAMFELVTVGPDWTSPKRLLGYRTPFGKLRHLEDGTETNESYEITNVVRLLLRASHPDVEEVPHFLIFDEMNLSHVERYFAPFLSLMEAANVLDEKAGVALIDEQDIALIADILKAEDSASAEARAAEALVVDGRSFTIPSNVFFVGTVNVDETTYMFSPKVLDRAHVIELESQKPSTYLLGEAARAGEEISVQQTLELLQESITDREEQRNEFPNPAQVLDRIKDLGFTDEEVASIKQATARALDGCYQLLLPVGFPFGYRIPKEVFAYLRVWISASILRGTEKVSILQQWPEALDRAVLQKVLPKIHGNKRTLGDSLRATAAFLGGSHTNSADPARYTLGINTTIAIAEHDVLTLGVNPQMKLSTEKLRAMHDRLVATGYVSFVS
jgi:energy-coupling factor transporter ATP-binding protein EcfA2